MKTGYGSMSSQLSNAVEQLTNAIAKPMRSHINRFFGLKCAPDLIAWGLYPNAKEITESCAAFEAARNKLGLDTQDRRTMVLCVGDGSTPRTGAMFAVRSAWSVVSVDPQMRNPGQWASKITRLCPFACRVEDLGQLYYEGRFSRAVVVAVHSHASLEASVRAVQLFPHVDVIAIPCCVDQSLDVPPDIEYEDPGIWSPKRTVKIWRDVLAQRGCP